VVTFPRSLGQVKAGLAEIEERELAHPRIRFFQERNPGWRQGEELMCVARMDWSLPLRYAWKAWRHRR
jgi:hypothetical protein